MMWFTYASRAFFVNEQAAASWLQSQGAGAAESRQLTTVRPVSVRPGPSPRWRTPNAAQTSSHFLCHICSDTDFIATQLSTQFHPSLDFLELVQTPRVEGHIPNKTDPISDASHPWKVPRPPTLLNNQFQIQGFPWVPQVWAFPRMTGRTQ